MRYRVFGGSTGLRISELILGTGTFGTSWGYGAEPDEARRILDAYLDAGGNFIDTSDSYQFGESETLLGEFIKSNRDDLVIGTKYTQGADPKGSLSVTGNSRKSMVRSLEQSLKRLQTERVDVYWVHMPDGDTPIEEIARGLDDLARAGKILYAGLSNFPAWRTAGAATLAALRGWAPIVAQQIEYSLVERTADRELLPMASAYGLATAAWSPLGGGVLTGKYRRGETGRQTEFGRLFHPEDSERKTAILNMLATVAAETDANSARVALAWISAKGLFPILGPKTLQQLDDNLGALSVHLSDEHVCRLDKVSEVPLGVPHEMMSIPAYRDRIAGGKRAFLDPPDRMVR